MKVAPVKAFFESEKPAEILVTHHKLNLEGEASEHLANHPLTTAEIKELCTDLKVLGKRDLSLLLKWRIKILRQQERDNKLKLREGIDVNVEAGSSEEAVKLSAVLLGLVRQLPAMWTTRFQGF